MHSIIKKTLKISFCLFIINLLFSTTLFLIAGETKLLEFVKIGGGYEVKGILASTFFFIIAFIVFLILYLLLPFIVGWIIKKISISYKLQKLFSGIYGMDGKKDIESNPQLYFRKMVSSMIIFAFVLLIFLNILYLELMQKLFVSFPIFGFIIILLVAISFFLSAPKIYRLFRN